MQFRKKPVVVDALQWVYTNYDDIKKFAGDAAFLDGKGMLKIKTKEGTMTANQGDWIIRGVEGEIYPCAPVIFDKTYEKVSS